MRSYETLNISFTPLDNGDFATTASGPGRSAQDLFALPHQHHAFERLPAEGLTRRHRRANGDNRYRSLFPHYFKRGDEALFDRSQKIEMIRDPLERLLSWIP